MRLKDKVAIVTGVASGIGKGTALLFGEEGAKIVGADINAEEGERTIEALRAKGAEATFVQTDVTKSEQVRSLVNKGVTAYGGVDVLFSNVGIVIGNTVDAVSEEEWDRVMAVNLKSMFLCCKYVIPQMQRRSKGSIVLMSSANALIAEPALVTYCTTKAAIVGMTKSLATDCGKYNIRVNCLCPSYTQTPLLKMHIDSGADPSLTWEKVNSLHLINRIAEVEEVARTALFLASDESSIITGTALVADGGLTCFR
jgi:NAD(P)-dependent dehydrogenase (short-subunit alcohol dehydrogenase family)